MRSTGHRILVSLVCVCSIPCLRVQKYTVSVEEGFLARVELLWPICGSECHVSSWSSLSELQASPLPVLFQPRDASLVSFTLSIATPQIGSHIPFITILLWVLLLLLCSQWSAVSAMSEVNYFKWRLFNGLATWITSCCVCVTLGQLCNSPITDRIL